MNPPGSWEEGSNPGRIPGFPGMLVAKYELVVFYFLVTKSPIMCVYISLHVAGHCMLSFTVCYAIHVASWVTHA